MLDIYPISSLLPSPQRFKKTALAGAVVLLATAGFTAHSSAATVYFSTSSTSGTEGDTITLQAVVELDYGDLGDVGETSPERTCKVDGNIGVALSDSSAIPNTDFTLSAGSFSVTARETMPGLSAPININLLTDADTDEGNEEFVLVAENITLDCTYYGDFVDTVDTTITIIDSENGEEEAEVSDPEDPIKENIVTLAPQIRQILTSTGDLSLEGVRVQTQNLSKQLRRLRNGLRGNDLSSLRVSIDGQSLSGNDIKRLLGAGAGDEALNSPLGTFMGGSVQIGEESDNNGADYAFDVHSLFFGADYHLSDNVIVGGAIGYTDSRSKINGEDSKSSLEGFSIAGFSSYYYKDIYYVDGIISYGVSDYKTLRQFGSGADTGIAKGETGGSELSIALNTGYYFRFNQNFVQVFGAVNYITASIDSYQETYNSGSTSGTLLIVDDQTQKSFTSNMGIEYGRTFNTKSAVVTPQLSLDWERQYEDGAESISGRFVGGTDIFNINDNQQDQSYFNLGLSLSAVFAGGFSAYTSYEIDLERDNFDVYDISLGMRWEF
ncbi:MAG: autotransporter outer membrane beta-barrel domain-containing protein [Cellvibrionaceae bacterium]|nr:autotransporter outer membrane beta-barrel domain-containing protein [Cellvibrionaceae bacterium]